MSLQCSSWRVALAGLLLLHVSRTIAGPQNAYYQYPNGQLKQLPAANSACGQCEPGTQREVVSGPYCGRCVPVSQSCANGYYLNGGQCQACPCPGTSGERRFGTSCRVDPSGGKLKIKS